MRIMPKILYKISGNLPCRLIDIEGNPYLERYYVGSIFGLTFYLHRFVSADSERNLHDHPWAMAVSFVLSGSYIESRLKYFDAKRGNGVCVQQNPVRWFNIILARCFHLIGQAKPETWTLFIHTKKIKGWGFLHLMEVVREGVRETPALCYSNPYAPVSSDWKYSASKGKYSKREALK